MTLKRIIPVALLIATAFAVTLALADIDGARIADRGDIIAFPIFTKTDSTETIDLRGSYGEITFLYHLTAMRDTVSIYIQGSHTKQRWVNLDYEGAIVHALADSGTYGFRYDGSKSLRFFRMVATSDSAFTCSSTCKIGR